MALSKGCRQNLHEFPNFPIQCTRPKQSPSLRRSRDAFKSFLAFRQTPAVSVVLSGTFTVIWCFLGMLKERETASEQAKFGGVAP